MDIIGMLSHLIFPEKEQIAFKVAAFGKLLQLHIALQQSAVVFQQGIEIERIELRYHAVDELTSQVAALVDEVAVVRRDHHQREFAYMVGESVVFFFVETERFLLFALLHTRHHLIVLAVMRIQAMDGEKILFMAYVLLVGCPEKALTEREIIDGIEDIGLPCPIESHETIDVL